VRNGLAQKEHSNPIGTLERELYDAQSKRDRLRGQLAAAEAALSEAVSSHRQALLEGGDDLGDSRDILAK
jgi:hypothetical protein